MSLMQPYYCTCCSESCSLELNEATTTGPLGGFVPSFPIRNYSGSGTGSIHAGTGTGSGSCGVHTPVHPECDFASCAAGIIDVGFSLEAYARRVFGAGNYTPRIIGGVLMYAVSTNDFGGAYTDAGYSSPSNRYLVLSKDSWKRKNGPVECSITVKQSVVFNGPTTLEDFVGYLVPMTVTINGYTWTRKSRCPIYKSGGGLTGKPADFGDFSRWTLDAASYKKLGVPKVSTKTFCGYIAVTTGAASYVWKPPKQNITLSFANHKLNVNTDCDQCPCMDGSICLKYVESSGQLVDGYVLGGQWNRIESTPPGTGTGSHGDPGTGTGTHSKNDIVCRHCSPGRVPSGGCSDAFKYICKSAQLKFDTLHNFSADAAIVPGTGSVRQCSLGEIIYSGVGNAIFFEEAWKLASCTKDVTKLPGVSDFHKVSVGLIGGFSCNGDLIGIGNGSCSDDGIPNTDPGPPADCPTLWCRYRWTGTYYTLDVSRCSASLSLTCPTPPLTYQGNIIYICCKTTTPPSLCTGGFECVNSSCQWTWVAFPTLQWVASVCPDDTTYGGCTCCGKPGRNGLFVGETIAGKCCSIDHGGCVTN